MTSGEAQRAFEQQTPVMFRWQGLRWRGPTVLSASCDGWWRAACRIYSPWVAASELRLATPHELLTAEDDG